MKTSRSHILVLRSLLLGALLTPFSLYSQFSQTNYIDIGKNYVSQSVFVKPVSSSRFNYNNFSVSLSLEFLLGTQTTGLSALNAGMAYELLLLKAPLTLGFAYLQSHPTQYVNELQYVVLMTWEKNRWIFQIGNNTRVFQLSRFALSNFSDNENLHQKIVEYRNLMYSCTYLLKKPESQWNIWVSVRNFDRFLIQQETNPLPAMGLYFDTQSRLRLFSEIWYQRAGLFNIRVNYFGVFTRFGLIWQTNST